MRYNVSSLHPLVEICLYYENPEVSSKPHLQYRTVLLLQIVKMLFKSLQYDSKETIILPKIQLTTIQNM